MKKDKLRKKNVKNKSKIIMEMETLYDEIQKIKDSLKYEDDNCDDNHESNYENKKSVTIDHTKNYDKENHCDCCKNYDESCECSCHSNNVENNSKKIEKLDLLLTYNLETFVSDLKETFSSTPYENWIDVFNNFHSKLSKLGFKNDVCSKIIIDNLFEYCVIENQISEELLKKLYSHVAFSDQTPTKNNINPEDLESLKKLSGMNDKNYYNNDITGSKNINIPINNLNEIIKNELKEYQIKLNNINNVEREQDTESSLKKNKLRFLKQRFVKYGDNPLYEKRN